MDFRAKRQEILRRIVKTADHNTMAWLYAAVVTLDKDSLTEAFRRVGKLTPRQLMQVFPVVKEYDGDRWGTKDYYYTMEAMQKHGLDKRIGRTSKAIHHVLWDFMNHNIGCLVVENRMSDPDLRLTTRQKTERWFQTQYCKLLTFNANLRAKQAERERPAPVTASLTKMFENNEMGTYLSYAGRRIFELMNTDAELEEHIHIDFANHCLALDVVGLERARPILQGYLGAERLDGMIEALRNRNEIDELTHQERLVFTRSASSCLRMLRDGKGIGEGVLADISPEQMQDFKKQAAEELRRRSIPMIVARLARYAYNTAKNGVKGWLFITRLKRHAAFMGNA